MFRRSVASPARHAIRQARSVSCSVRLAGGRLRRLRLDPDFSRTPRRDRPPPSRSPGTGVRRPSPRWPAGCPSPTPRCTPRRKTASPASPASAQRLPRAGGKRLGSHPGGHPGRRPGPADARRVRHEGLGFFCPGGVGRAGGGEGGEKGPRRAGRHARARPPDPGPHGLLPRGRDQR